MQSKCLNFGMSQGSILLGPLLLLFTLCYCTEDMISPQDVGSIFYTDGLQLFGFPSALSVQFLFSFCYRMYNFTGRVS